MKTTHTQPVADQYSIALKSAASVGWGDTCADVLTLRENGIDILEITLNHGDDEFQSVMSVKGLRSNAFAFMLPKIRSGHDLNAKVYEFISTQAEELGLEFIASLFESDDGYEIEIPIAFETDGIVRV